MKKTILSGAVLAAAVTLSTGVALAEHPHELVASADAGVMSGANVSQTVLIPAVTEDAAMAVHVFVSAWIEDYWEHKVEHDDWMDDDAVADDYADCFIYHLDRRGDFYERAHNWNGHNESDHHYNYMTMVGRHGNGSHENSYGIDVLDGYRDGLSDILEYYVNSGMVDRDMEGRAIEQQILEYTVDTQDTIMNEELRFYLNESLWFAAKQTVKEMK